MATDGSSAEFASGCVHYRAATGDVRLNGTRPARGTRPRRARRSRVTGFDETLWALKRDVLYTFDLRCPSDFAPRCVDGEVDSFECLPVAELVRLVRCHADEVQFKPNVAVVFIDFLL